MLVTASITKYGKKGYANKWFTSYLKDRRQTVPMKSPNTHKNVYSNWNKLQHGISLGSTVSSFLFL